jgi:hypothetical protein
MRSAPQTFKSGHALVSVRGEFDVYHVFAYL